MWTRLIRNVSNSFKLQNKIIFNVPRQHSIYFIHFAQVLDTTNIHTGANEIRSSITLTLIHATSNHFNSFHQIYLSLLINPRPLYSLNKIICIPNRNKLSFIREYVQYLCVHFHWTKFTLQWYKTPQILLMSLQLLLWCVRQPPMF